MRWPGISLLLVLVACSGAAPPPAGQRIISVAPNLTELLYAAGAADQLVAVSEYSDYPEAARSLPRVGDAFRLDYERIVALAPTVAVVWATGTPPEVAARLAALGIRVVSIPTRNLEDVALALETLGELAGTRDVGARAAAEYRAGIAALRARYQTRAPLRVFIQIDDAPLFTVGGSHLISEIVELCGGQNVFAGADAAALPVDLESVMARAPQVILSTDDGDPQEYWARFSGLAAVAIGSIYRAPADLLARPSPRLVAGATEVCAQLDDAPRRSTRYRGAARRPARGSARRGAAALVLPEHFAAGLVAREHACDHEQQVRQPVEITQRRRRDLGLPRQRPARAALRAGTQRARHGRQPQPGRHPAE